MSHQMVLDTPLLVAYENVDDRNEVRQLRKKLVLPYLVNKKQWAAAKNSDLKISGAEHRQYLAGFAN